MSIGGFSSTALARVRQLIERRVDSRFVPGVPAILARMSRLLRHRLVQRSRRGPDGDRHPAAGTRLRPEAADVARPLGYCPPGDRQLTAKSRIKPAGPRLQVPEQLVGGESWRTVGGCRYRRPKSTTSGVSHRRHDDARLGRGAEPGRRDRGEPVGRSLRGWLRRLGWGSGNPPRFWSREPGCRGPTRVRCLGCRAPTRFGGLPGCTGSGQDLRLVTSSVAVGRTLWRSPTTPKSTSSKMGASGSLLMATMVFEVCMPARCWMAPEMPAAT